MLTELSHKTADVEYGATDDGVSFKAYMNSGNYCHIGELDIGEINDRERGWFVHLWITMKTTIL